ncbi:uncharacterized protein [Oscarella lobularis]|uniref:uncharacterized protein n=1 Tax=Oscarella lobularis TaxID=121494 RepID=UPI0033130FAF
MLFDITKAFCFLVVFVRVTTSLSVSQRNEDSSLLLQFEKVKSHLAALERKVNIRCDSNGVGGVFVNFTSVSAGKSYHVLPFSIDGDDYLYLPGKRSMVYRIR